MTASKTNTSWGFAGKVESAYGTINAPGTGDGIFTIEPPDVNDPQFVSNGDRGNSPSGAKRINTAAAGRFGGMKVATEGIGGGVAYSASVKPVPDLLLRTSGMAVTTNFGVGTESYRYSPIVGPSGLESATYDAFLAGQQHRIYGAYSDFEIVGDGPGVPRWMFEILGIADYNADAAIPAFTSYPDISNTAAVANSIALTLGLFTAGKVRSFHFTAGRKHDQARLDLNAAAAHAGFTPAGRDPTLEFVVERVALATVSPWSTATTLNPYRMAEDKNLVICSFGVGATQYKRWKLWAGGAASAAQAQVMDVQDTYDGPTATWTIKVGFRPSTYALQDDFSITFD